MASTSAAIDSLDGGLNSSVLLNIRRLVTTLAWVWAGVARD
jgi:hypothetical protein